MPEGLAQTMTDQELVDLLSYLTTLRRPVSIVGEYQVIGPVNEPDGAPVVDPASKLDLQAPVADGRGSRLSWRRASANAEGQADFTYLIAGDPKHAAYATIPVDSPIGQQAGLSWTLRSTSSCGSMASAWHSRPRARTITSRGTRSSTCPKA